MNYYIRLMISIYQTIEYDWLGDKIKNTSKLTKHHIVKKEFGGENGVSNYALLTEKSHKLIHLLEEKDPQLYDKLNYMFLELNRSLKPPTRTYYRRINELLNKNKEITRSKGKRK